ncbi:MAG TPA: phosphoribosyl-AMP cyclohydrolase [Candidatus Nanoarchaeia archaeon]|nr:phosphoribosyl-AMP cyclohydrolase [Candidatus Nanoarchaeia archaeon]
MNAEENLIDKLDWKKMDGLIPVIVQDANTKEVLMLAYANREALENTLKTGKGTYWSRSRQELWVKGETSGHTQKIQRVIADCDYDAVLYVVQQKGPVCHTGAETCFHHEFKC